MKGFTGWWSKFRKGSAKQKDTRSDPYVYHGISLTPFDNRDSPGVSLTNTFS